MQIEDIAAKGQLVQIVYAQHDVANSQTDVALNVQETANGQHLQVTGVSMPFSGQIVGISVDLSGAATTGTLTVSPTVDGVIVSGATQTITTQQAAHAKFERYAHKIDAGSKLGVKISTNGGWDGHASDLFVVVYVLVQMTGI